MEGIKKKLEELSQIREKQKERWILRKIDMKLEGCYDPESAAVEKAKYFDPKIETQIATLKAKVKNCDPEFRKKRQKYYQEHREEYIARNKRNNQQKSHIS